MHLACKKNLRWPDGPGGTDLNIKHMEREELLLLLHQIVNQLTHSENSSSESSNETAQQGQQLSFNFEEK